MFKIKNDQTENFWVTSLLNSIKIVFIRFISCSKETSDIKISIGSIKAITKEMNWYLVQTDWTWDYWACFKQATKLKALLLDASILSN